MRFTAASAQGV
jgi:YfiH family protein